MVAQESHNYLKMYRRRAGLTQAEMAYLLGFDNKGVVSRYEKRTRIPPLQAAIACEAVFGIPVSELFAGMRETAEKDIQKRLLELRSKLQTKDSKGSEAQVDAHKLQWISGRLGRAAISDKQTQ